MKQSGQSARLAIPMTHELKEAVEAAARGSGDAWVKVSAAEFVRQAIIEKLKRDAHVYPVRVAQ
jgi:hypothetical protein